MVGHVTHVACMYLVGVTKTPRHGLPLHLHAMPCGAVQSNAATFLLCSRRITQQIIFHITLSFTFILPSLSPLPWSPRPLNEVPQQGKIGEP